MPDAASSFDLPLEELVALVHRRRLDPADNLNEALARYRRLGRRLGAYVTRDSDISMAQSEFAGYLEQPEAVEQGLRGITVSIKDLFGLHGSPTFAGSPARLPAQYELEGPVVGALRRLGCVVTGKTHTVEFAFGGLGTNPHWPVPRNPWDANRHRVPGGSSAGAGVSLHCDAQLALGTDTAGSVRIPASMTGCAGLKTSYGRWPTRGIVPLSPSLDSVGILARTVADLRYAFGLIDGALTDADAGRGMSAKLPALKELKLGLCEEFFWRECSPGVAERVREAIEELGRAGARFERLILPETEPANELFLMGHLASCELYEFLCSELPSWLDSLDPAVQARMADAAELPAYEYLRRRRRLRQLRESAQQRLQGAEVVVTPTVAVTPPTLDEVAAPERYRRANLLALRNTSMGNLLGLCAVTLPVGLDQAGMPVGLQILGRHGQDARVLDIAAAIERVLGPARERLGRAPLTEAGP